VGCHQKIMPGIVNQWTQSKHKNADVSCLDCHETHEGNPGAFEHNKKIIKIIVSPQDCGKCHQVELDQFKGSVPTKNSVPADFFDFTVTTS